MLKNRCGIVPSNSPADPLPTPPNSAAGQRATTTCKLLIIRIFPAFVRRLLGAETSLSLRSGTTLHSGPARLRGKESHRRGSALAYCGGARIGEQGRARHRPDDEHVALAADLDLMARKGGKVEPGAQHRLLRDHQLAAIGLGQGFEPARGVDGVADRGDRGGGAIAHLDDDRRPDMDADADAQWLIELPAQPLVQLL